MAIDITNCYTHNNFKDYQYMRFAMSEIPQEIIDEYNLKTIVHEDRYCYTGIRKAIYGLREAGFIANVKLKRILRLEKYVPSKFTPGLFTHKTKEIAFSLVVDNFSVIYKKREDIEHLLKTIQDRYPVKAEWDSTFYLGVTSKFDYEERSYKISMPGYVKQALIKLHHKFSKTTHSPSPFNALVYGQKIQMTTINKTNLMITVQTKLLQQVYGTFVYYARSVDFTMLHVLNDLAIRVKDGTQKTVKALNYFLDYCVTHPEATVLYPASDMILHNHSDATYLVVTGARSKTARYLLNWMKSLRQIPTRINVLQ